MTNVLGFDEEALWRVEVGRFIKRGIPIRGVIHVGANDGYEIDWYLKLGIKHILAIEPENEAFHKLREKFRDNPRVILYWGALGDKACHGVLKVPTKDTGGSTLLTELPNCPSVMGVTHHFDKWQGTPVTTFGRLIASFPDFYRLEDYNCLVVDVQGMELQVLKGFGPHLEKMDCLNIECSEVPLYEGEAPASEVVAWLAERGFDAITPIQPHNDILFARRRFGLRCEEVLSG